MLKRFVVVLTLCAASALPAQSTPQGCAERHANTRPDPVITQLINPIDNAIQFGRIDEALDLVTKAVTAYPGNSRLEDAHGRVLYRQGELFPAIQAINQAIQLDPCNGRAHYDAWRVDSTAGLFEAAQAQLEIAHAVTPDASLFTRAFNNTQLPSPPGVVIDSPPHFNFYARHQDCGGIPIRAASVVDPAVMPAACAFFTRMLQHLPNARANMIVHGSELHIMGADQIVSDLPEFRDERGERTHAARNAASTQAPKVDIDSIASATGGIYSNCPESNLLHLPGYPWAKNSEVCLHEIAHNIMGSGFDQGMREQIYKQYNTSIARGLWKGTYAATNYLEYWAELSCWYFGYQGVVGHMDPPLAPGAEALKGYDPEAYALLDRFYSGQKQPHLIHRHDAGIVTSIDPDRGRGEPAELLLINNTPGRRRLYSVSLSGVPREYAIIEPYSRKLIETYTQQYWLISDPRANTRTLISLYNPDSQFTIDETPKPTAAAPPAPPPR